LPPPAGAPRLPPAWDRRGDPAAAMTPVRGPPHAHPGRRRAGGRVLREMRLRAGRRDSGDVGLCRGRALRPLGRTGGCPAGAWGRTSVAPAGNGATVAPFLDPHSASVPGTAA